MNPRLQTPFFLGSFGLLFLVVGSGVAWMTWTEPPSPVLRLPVVDARALATVALLRLIGKWLNAGVVDEGKLSFPEAGTPQGGVISPLLANIYLHEVLDVWFECVVKPRLGGRAFLVRYADDFLIGFSDELDARRVMTVLPKRFEKYGLALHPKKTRLLRFHPPGRGVESGSFDLLGFTHHWARSRKGYWVIKQRTAKERFQRSLRAIADWCRTYRHRPLQEQCAKLSAKLRGHYGYFGITGNSMALQRFRYCVQRIWQKWLTQHPPLPGVGPGVTYILS